MAVLWKSQGLFCRGIACYHVWDPVDRKEYTVKDCWITEAKRYHKVDVLERVKGIPNVVQLVDHWDPAFGMDKVPCLRTGWTRGSVTDLLWDFSSRKELICAFCDFVVAHEAIIQQRVLHRDLSPNNFVISEGIGYFIDFDHVSIIKESETFTVSFGTGTVPYISMCILKKMSKNTDNVKKSKTTINARRSNNRINSLAQMALVEHNPSDNLEAHGTLTPTWDKTTMLYADAYENLGTTSGLLAIFLVKKGAMSEDDILSDRVSDYFSEFKPIINKWHT
ncbi:hypothetical protein EV424DRAFT_1343246 [Suillus variegatus]|nr:hypothetical protein EV424DRAFT_1343246 [Suillus variegatus]